MTSVSVEEKRLKLLKQQLFGKELPLTTGVSQVTQSLSKSPKPSSDISFIDPVSIKRDLTKVVIFSFIALLFQFLTFFAVSRGLLKLFN